ncbi:LAME_0H14686g1_1 [Lachancea meyersii CBS 8951]|uniref:LAME_0H14686g1_1 n=1 Tax=Lachancea meyersii CBS 8951 TaxID=1266667 RepID=A0A1G4KHJ9_9SACH|nr:LAME_0H14686g1_1 [Lachancea meyersii CBS 8951]
MRITQITVAAAAATLALVEAEEFLIRLKAPKTLAKLVENHISDDLLDAFSEGKILKTFSFGKFEGFTVDFPMSSIAKLRNNPLVAEIVPNVEFNVFDNESSEKDKSEGGGDGEKDKSDGDEEDDDDDDEEDDDNDEEDDDDDDSENDKDDIEFSDISAQTFAPRHLARISRRSALPYNPNDVATASSNFSYYYDMDFLGTCVNAYVIDTGIYKEHNEFDGRAIFGADFTGEGPGDFNGHGTHVAGLIGSKTFGVAKDVSLIEVKALNAKGQGNLTSVISALEFTVNHCRDSKRGCVANLSLGSFRNSVLNQAVEAALEAGVVIVVAAGNSNANACWSSPASSLSSLTVGAFDDRTDTIARFSNWGNCVDIFAPGVKVYSVANKPHFSPVAYSGTSMASPIVAGMAALLLDSGVHPLDVKKGILELSTDSVFHKRSLVFKPGTPNKILFTGVDKQDDVFDNAVYPGIDIDQLVKDLESYNKDGHVAEDDATLPLGEIKLKKRSRVTTLMPFVKPIYPTTVAEPTCTIYSSVMCH